ncbi:MAG: hypothetical protein ACFNQI_03545 [Eikenella corrodens]
MPHFRTKLLSATATIFQVAFFYGQQIPLPQSSGSLSFTQRGYLNTICPTLFSNTDYFSGSLLPSQGYLKTCQGLLTATFPSGFLPQRRQIQGGNRNKVGHLARISNAEDAAFGVKRRGNQQLSTAPKLLLPIRFRL